MVTVRLSAGFEAILDDENFRLAGFKWSAQKTPTTVYARSKMGYMHRVVMQAKPGQIVDHINGNTLDNRRENLRFVTAKENMLNRVSNFRRKHTAHKGVVKSPKGNWVAQIKNDGVHFHIGTFANEAHAAAAYDLKAIELWGGHALTNFPRALIEIVDVTKLRQIKTRSRKAG